VPVLAVEAAHRTGAVEDRQVPVSPLGTLGVGVLPPSRRGIGSGGTDEIRAAVGREGVVIPVQNARSGSPRVTPQSSTLGLPKTTIPLLTLSWRASVSAETAGLRPQAGNFGRQPVGQSTRCMGLVHSVSKCLEVCRQTAPAGTDLRRHRRRPLPAGPARGWAAPCSSIQITPPVSGPPSRRPRR
jgi:hypothetical protein